MTNRSTYAVIHLPFCILASGFLVTMHQHSELWEAPCGHVAYCPENFTLQNSHGTDVTSFEKHFKPIAYPPVSVSLLEAMIYATKSCKLANNLWYNSQLKVLDWTSNVPNNQVSENEFVSWKNHCWVSLGIPDRQLAVLLPQQESSKLPLLCSLKPPTGRFVREFPPSTKTERVFWEIRFGSS